MKATLQSRTDAEQQPRGQGSKLLVQMDFVAADLGGAMPRSHRSLRQRLFDELNKASNADDTVLAAMLAEGQGLGYLGEARPNVAVATPEQ